MLRRSLFVSRIARSSAIVSGSLALIVGASLLPALSATADDAPVPDIGISVDGNAAGDVGAPVDPASSISTPLPAAVDLHPAHYSIALSRGATGNSAAMTDAQSGGISARASGPGQQIGTTGITIAPATTVSSVFGGAQTLWGPPAVAAVSADVVDAATMADRGFKGLALKLSRADGSKATGELAVQVPDAVLSSLFGADFAGRAQWVEVPADAPADKVTARSQPVASVRDASTGMTTLTPQVNSTAMLLTPMGAPVSTKGTGAFSATDLKPASKWDVSAQTGDFSWTLPLRTPPAAAGPSPALNLSYDSQSVDGETASTNNQPSTVGEGWSLGGGGYIERTYVSCSQDDGTTGAVTTSGDLCYKTDNATISLGGHSGQLILDSATGVWKLQNDDGSRIQHLVGAAQGCASNGTYDADCWRLTTTDGTQYYFGLNQLPGWSAGKPATNSTFTVPVFGNDPGEPCNTGTFATSSCVQGWRWNLDYVVDTHANVEALYYDKELNNYLKNGTTAVDYVRGGQLDHIDYGLTATTVYSANAASDKVVFGYDQYGRCNDTTHASCTTETLTAPAIAAAHPTAYPDVPFDQFCVTASCPNMLSPTFWTTGMLDTITTKVFTGGSYANVDGWTLGHSFPDPGDGTTAALWLTKVGHTGYSGSTTLTEPDTIFTGGTLQNRVWVVDALAPLEKYRISGITTSTGAVISVNYLPSDCTPANAAAIEANAEWNDNRCFPEKWVPKITPPQPAKLDLFQKYVVSSVVSDPRTGGGADQAQSTQYIYTGQPAWRYNPSALVPAADRTWSDFAGYNSVEIRVGNPSAPSTEQTTDYTFFQGMDGDHTSAGPKSVSVVGTPGLLDSRWFAGRTREAVVHNGAGGPVISDTVTTPWGSATTATDGIFTAHLVNDAESAVTQPLSSGGNRTTDTKTTFDPTYGLPLTVDAITPDAGTTCTTTSYAAANTGAWIVGLPKEVSKVGVDCANLASANELTDAISDTRISYDGLAAGVAPTKGSPTMSEIVDSYTGPTAIPHWVPSALNSYDSMGRVTSSTDILGHISTTTYTPAAGAGAGSGALTKQVVKNTAPFNWTQTTTFNPAWGAETSATDENGKITTAIYDALGRRVSVWLPNNAQSAGADPSIHYAYSLSQTAPTAVATTTLTAALTKTTYALYDGLGQLVQTQGPAEGGGAVLADTAYDTQGRVAYVNNPYWTMSVNPSTTLFVPLSEQNIGSQLITNYDAVGRTTSTIQNSFAAERFRTSYSYPGADRTDTTPPTGGTPTTSYTNSLGQQTKLVQYLAATPTASATQEATTYSYNVQGKMTQMVDPAGNTWSWGFDVLGHQIRAVDPDTGESTSTFDDAGNQLTSRDARGVTLAYSYDALNRKTGQYLNAATSAGSILASWTYDSIAKNQLTSSSAYTGSTPGHPGLAYTTTATGYDDAYNATGTTVSIPSGAPAFGGTSYTNSYGYNVDGTLMHATHPAEGGLPVENVRYSYTANGNLSGITGSSNVLVGSIYTAIGQIAQYDRGGATAVYSTYGYDPATAAINEIKETTVSGSTFTMIADRKYAHDDAGNVTSASTTGTAATDTQCYQYDHLRALTQAWTPSSNSCAVAPSSSGLGGPAPYWESFTVDPATGNRTAAVKNPVVTGGPTTTDSYSYLSPAGPHPHAVQSVSHTTVGAGAGTTTSGYGYDQEGGTVARPGQSLTYDPAGRVASVTVGGAVQSSVYDASGGLLLQSDATSGATLFLGDTELHLAPGAAGSAATAVRTYSANGTPVGERSTKVGVSGTVMKWLGTDIDVTSDVEVDSTSGVVTRRFQDPFGNARGAALPVPGWSSSHGFLNAPTSTLTALTQLGARAYDSTIGKFSSVDSVLSPFNPQQNNGYAYASNTPITMSDPSGLCPLNAAMNGCDPAHPRGDYETQTTTPPPAAGNDGGGGGNSGGSSGGGIFSHPTYGSQFSHPYPAAPATIGLTGSNFADQYAQHQQDLTAENERESLWESAQMLELLAFLGFAEDGGVGGGDLSAIGKSADQMAANAAKVTATQMAAKEAENLPSLALTASQLESKFKHASDFGVSAPRGASGFHEFGDAVTSFVGDSSTIRVSGSYRGDDAILNFNPDSKLVVVQSSQGSFVSGWKMSAAQLQSVQTRGSLGGG